MAVDHGRAHFIKFFGSLLLTTALGGYSAKNKSRIDYLAFQAHGCPNRKRPRRGHRHVTVPDEAGRTALGSPPPARDDATMSSARRLVSTRSCTAIGSSRSGVSRFRRRPWELVRPLAADTAREVAMAAGCRRPDFFNFSGSFAGGSSHRRPDLGRLRACCRPAATVPNPRICPERIALDPKMGLDGFSAPTRPATIDQRQNQRSQLLPCTQRA